MQTAATCSDPARPPPAGPDAEGVIQAARERLARLYRDKPWRGDWARRLNDPTGHEAVGRVVRDVLDLARGAAERGDLPGTKGFCLLAEQIAAGEHFDRTAGEPVPNYSFPAEDLSPCR